MVGPHMPWPMMKVKESLPKAPSSCCQITRSIGEAPRPPYSFGQCRQAQPASAFFFCHALATSRTLAPLSAVRPSEDLFNSSSYCFGAFAAIQALASARKAASCGVSSKFMVRPSQTVAPHGEEALAPSRTMWPDCGLILRDAASRLLWMRMNPSPRASRRVPLPHAIDQGVFPIRHRAQRERGGIRAPVIEMAIELPGESHAAVDLDVILRAMLKRVGGADPCGGGGLRQFTGIGGKRPGAVIAIGARQCGRDIHVGQHVLDRLERPDRPAEGDTVERV